MEVPEGVSGVEGIVWRLLKCLYGLKQSPRMWNQTIDKVLVEIGFVRLKTDHGVYVFGVGDGRVFIALYVDDLLMVWKRREVLEMVKRRLQEKFEMKDLGALTHILGVEVKRDRQSRILTLHQSSYVQQVLERYGMSDCNPTKLPFSPHLTFSPHDEPTLKPDLEIVTDYRAKVGSLIYAMKQTRIDICYPLGVLAKHMSNPGPPHIKALHQLLRSPQGTKDFGLTYAGQRSFEVSGYCDASYKFS